MTLKSRNHRGDRVRKWGFLCILVVVAAMSMGAGPFKYTEDRLPSNLNPVYADDMYSVRVTELMFERLIGWSRENTPTPMLATSWQISADKRSVVINLRQGVTWHDGKPFTAKDVVFTINVMRDKKGKAQITDRYLAAIIKKVKILSPTQLKIFFKKPLNEPAKWLQFKVIPAHAFKKGKVRRTGVFSQRPIGTGPYKFKRWAGQRIQMVRYTNHWRKKKARLSKAYLQAIPDKNIQVEVLRYGGIDAIVRVRPKDIPVFEKDQNVRLHPYSTNDWWYVALNQKRGSLLRDKRVRQALVYALDRESLRNAHLGDGTVISGPFSPNDPLYNFAVNPRTLSKKKAGALLDAAGWKGTSLRKKGRKTLTLRMLVPKSKGSYKALCLSMQSALRKIGVKLNLVWLGDAAWRRNVFTKKDFDMALHIWNFDDLSTIYPLFHSRGSRNYVGFKSKVVDALLTKANKTTDPAIYKAIYYKIHKQLHEEVPYLFLWSLTNYTAVSTKVKDVTIHPFNYFHFLHTWSKKGAED